MCVWIRVLEFRCQNKQFRKISQRPDFMQFQLSDGSGGLKASNSNTCVYLWYRVMRSLRWYKSINMFEWVDLFYVSTKPSSIISYSLLTFDYGILISSGPKFGQLKKKKKKRWSRDYIISSKLINQKLLVLKVIQAAITNFIETIYIL